MIRANKKLLTGATFALCLSLALAGALSGISCKMGLGEEIDLIGPSLTITSHANLQYVGKNITLSGTCSDNVKVERVVVENVTAQTTYANSVIGTNTWSIDLVLPEGEETLKVTAYDKNSNSSASSVKQLTLLVDATDPFMKELYVQRMPGYSAAFKVLGALKALDSELSQNMDDFQNGKFTIRGASVDNYSLSSVVLTLTSEAGTTVLTKTLSAGSNMTTPSFEIAPADLTVVDAAYATGKHYLYASIASTDIGGNSKTNSYDYFCWYPEADMPRIKQSMTVANQLIIPKDNAIPVEYFDDDGLSEVYVKMVPSSDWDAVSGADDEAKLQTLVDDATARSTLLGSSALSGSTRVWQYTLPVTWTLGKYALVTLAKDAKSDGSASVWSTRKIDVQVTDQDSPLTIITGPAENTFPTLSGGTTFNVSGYCLDNGDTTDLMIAWLPYGLSGGADSHIAQAQALLQASSLAPGSSATDSSGIKLWSVTLGAPGSRTLNSKPYQERTFSLPMNIFTTFMYSGSLENKLKLFVVMTRDNDDNVVFQTFRLQGDVNAPAISVVSPPTEMRVYSLDGDLTLSFSATKANGLGMDTYSLIDITDKLNPIPLSLTTLGAIRSATVDQATLAGYGESRRTYQFIAKDMLGNESKEQRTVILSNLPVLRYITSGEMDKTYKAGDQIQIQAVFSKPVKVTGTPRLDIRYSAGDGTAKYASYSQGTGTDTLVFTYTVPTGAVSADLCSDPAPIDLNGGTITTTEGTGGDAIIAGLNGAPDLAAADLLQTRKNLALEGVRPSITSILITGGNDVGGKQYFKAGDVMKITLSASETLSVSGSPTLVLNNGITGTFYKTDVSDLVFTHVVGVAENVTSVAWTPASAFSAGDLATITDLVGNAVLSVAGALDANTVIDTTVPATPTIAGPASGDYNTAQTITLSGLEANAIYKYSVDGGLAWSTYNPAAKPSLPAGSYRITAMQTDLAGNSSGSPSAVTVNVNGVFPSITAVSCEQPTGTYAAGATLTYKLAFSAKVKTDAAGSAYITLSDGVTSVNVGVTPDTVGSTVLYFTYTVPSGVSMLNALPTAMSLSGFVTDLYGNTTADAVPPPMTGKTIDIDSVAPTFVPASSVPLNNGISSVVDGNGKTISVQLAFSEDVFAESGNIVIEPSGDWIIPPVMTETEFSEVYYSSALSSADRTTLMTGADGAPVPNTATPADLTDYTLGGPYQKTTHGIVNSAGSYVPDTSTKYVLRYDLDPSATSGEVSAIRTALVKAGFRKQTIDVTSSSVSIAGNVVTVTFPAHLVKGRLWSVTIPSGGFRDRAGNKTAAQSSHLFWSNGVETPVIRVRRYSYGDIPANVVVPGTTSAPTGTTDARIDCETPGAAILYGTLALTSSAASNPNPSTTPVSYAITDATSAQVTGITAGTTYGSAFSIGNGSYTNSQKIYIAATATRSMHTASNPGYEGAYKTTIIHYYPQYSGYNHVIQGSTIQGGIPTISGFPLRDAHTDPRNSKYCHKTGTGTGTIFYWTSWEIAATFYTQGKYDYPAGNYQNGYDQVNPGSLVCTYRRAFYPSGSYVQ
jgi:large repetitive protein